MSNYPQSLLFTTGWPQAWLREISGFEEQSIAGTHVMEAINLIDKLLVKGHRAETTAQKLASPDRDRIMAAIYQQTYGDQIKGTLECSECEALFDMDFSLAGFVDHTHQPQPEAATKRLNDGSFLLADGLQMRLPTGEDEMSVMGLSEEELANKLLERCLIKGKAEEVQPEVMESLAELAPMLQTEITSTCPECGHEMAVFFDIQVYLLQSLLQDQEGLSWEIHRLATAYGWGLKEILELPRSVRKRYSNLIEAERYTGLS